MRILAISTLFPTPEMTNHGIFVRNRLTAMSAEKDCNISIINITLFEASKALLE